MNIKKIAKKLIARSQIVKICSINNNLINCKIYCQIYLNQFTYNFKGLQKDAQDFLDQVNRNIDDIGLPHQTLDDVKMDIDGADGLLRLTCIFKVNASDELIQKIREDQWIISDFS